MTGDWTDQVGGIEGLDPVARGRLRTLCQTVVAPAGTRIFEAGHSCGAYLFLLSGQVRVCRTGESGREIVLYRVEPGETCVVTTTCLMSGTDYDADGIAEADIVAQALPITGFRVLMAEFESFRTFVFKAFGTRIGDLLLLIEEVAFGRIDQRLASHLLDRAAGRDMVSITHQDLAVELGTAREVVSRQLKEFEHRGWVTLGRGQVRLMAPRALEGLAKK